MTPLSALAGFSFVTVLGSALVPALFFGVLAFGFALAERKADAIASRPQGSISAGDSSVSSGGRK